MDKGSKQRNKTQLHAASKTLSLPLRKQIDQNQKDGGRHSMLMEPNRSSHTLSDKTNFKSKTAKSNNECHYIITKGSKKQDQTIIHTMLELYNI